MAPSLAWGDTNIEGYDFSLFDVMRGCEAVQIGDDVSIDCRGRALAEVELLCDVVTFGSTQGDIDCRGMDLIEIENACYVLMNDDLTGDIIC